MTEPYKPKLIEVALPLMKINAESAREKSIRHGHPSTLHLWWARRPLAAARAVLWASLVDDPSAHPDRFPTEADQQRERDRLFDILERLVPWEASTDEQVLAEAKAEIDKCFGGDPPSVLDPFGGGGTIPLEAQRLGLRALSGDLNPVAVLIQRAMLEVPSRFAGEAPVHPDLQSQLSTWARAQGLAADVDVYGRWMREEAERRIGHLYPMVDGPKGKKLTPIAWIWARTVTSPDPTWHGAVPLVRSWVMAKKPGQPVIWVKPEIDRSSHTISFSICEGGSPPAGNVIRGTATCIATGSPISGAYIKAEGQAGRLGQQLLAVVAEGDRKRIFCPPSELHQSASECEPPSSVPVGRMADHPQYMGTPRYGLDEWSKLYTPRQLTALATFSELLGEVAIRVKEDAVLRGMAPDNVRLRDGGSGADAYADAIVTYLAFAVDKCADYWSSIATWAEQGFIRNTFARQAIQMTWDFAEVNPFSDSTGNWMSMVEWVGKAIAGLPAKLEGETAQRDARARVAEVGSCAVSTDPPYYDNVPYSDISDFFYVWLRRNLGDVWPDECATLLTPKSEELVADQQRFGGRVAAHQHFEAGMAEVFAEVARAQDPRVPATVFYAFKQTEDRTTGRSSTGWETFLQALLDAGLSVNATWPVRTEKPGRSREIGANALASSVVLACRPRAEDAVLETRGGFIAALHHELPGALRVLQQENIAPVDLAQSAIGPGMRVFSSYGKVVEADGTAMTVRTALSLINEVLGEVLSAEEAELDPDSRFALTWFEQFAHNPGSHGDADVLARAKDTSVAGVVEAGIAVSRDGRLRLLDRQELPEDWSPLTDDRATVWESTQQMIRKLGNSESEAASLLAQLGGVADRARQLAYLLYGVCERKGWADEAVAYNGLITAWPELIRQASSAGSDTGQQTLM